MKRSTIVMATTNVDRHMTKFSRESLEQAAAYLRDRYIPFLREHDLLRPLGRIFGGSVRERADGEWELVVEAEELEGKGEIPPVHPEYEFRPVPPKDEALHPVVGDEFVRDAKSRPVVAELEALLRRPAEIEGRRALEPPDLLKIAGLVALGKIAEGFLTQLGADGLTELRKVLVRLFGTRKSAERRLMFDLFFMREGVEVILILANPTPDNIDAVLREGLQQLDEMLPGLLAALPDTRRVVAEYDEDGVWIAYVVGKDCLPREVRR